MKTIPVLNPSLLGQSPKNLNSYYVGLLCYRNYSLGLREGKGGVMAEGQPTPSFLTGQIADPPTKYPHRAMAKLGRLPKAPSKNKNN